MPNIENDIITIKSNIKDIPNMKTSLDNVKYRQSAINMHIDRLTPLNDNVKNNSDNITKIIILVKLIKRNLNLIQV